MDKRLVRPRLHFMLVLGTASRLWRINRKKIVLPVITTSSSIIFLALQCFVANRIIDASGVYFHFSRSNSSNKIDEFNATEPQTHGFLIIYATRLVIPTF